MGNCVMTQHETTWVDDYDEESSEFSERQTLLREEVGVTEVKIRITKRQLEELLRHRRLSAEKVLEQMLRRKMETYEHEHVKDGHWQPRLQSIPEVQDER